jgi:glycosyltransferase involved in cell wall biosynthesis
MNPAVAALGISEDSVSAVPFGVDTQRFVPPAAPRLENDTLRLICTRNFAPIYDVSTLITALQRVAQRGLRLQVDLIGEGPLRPELEAQVASSGIAPWVTFHGHVNHTRLAELLAQAHIFVTPALSDGNNVSLNEAMACACFPIATDIPANAQWLEHGTNGLLYPPGDAEALTECILRAAADATWRAHAGKLNRDIVEQRADWRVCVSRMSDTYTRAIAHAGASS